MQQLSVLELCAGAGGQALGYEQAGFEHAGLVELDATACKTLRLNRPDWNVIQADLAEFDGRPYRGIDILTGGLPCPPFSVAGKQLGDQDERNLFPHAFRIVEQTRPAAVMIENVRGLLDPLFADYRKVICEELLGLGYETDFRLLHASSFGVPQLRPRVVIVGLRKRLAPAYSWPQPLATRPRSVGDTLHDLMASNGWVGAAAWREHAQAIAPTIVGGSKKHGGPDLGPTRARQAWAALGVNGKGIAAEAPSSDFEGMPKLTVRMVARIQGFPDDWQFCGGKTAAYKQVGNAFPPAVARNVADSLRMCITGAFPLTLAG